MQNEKSSTIILNSVTLNLELTKWNVSKSGVYKVYFTGELNTLKRGIRLLSWLNQFVELQGVGNGILAQFNVKSEDYTLVFMFDEVNLDYLKSNIGEQSNYVFKECENNG